MYTTYTPITSRFEGVCGSAWIPSPGSRNPLDLHRFICLYFLQNQLGPTWSLGLWLNYWATPWRSTSSLTTSGLKRPKFSLPLPSSYPTWITMPYCAPPVHPIFHTAFTMSAFVVPCTRIAKCIFLSFH